MLVNLSRTSGSAQRVVDALRKLSKLQATVADHSPLVDLIDKLGERRQAERVGEWKESYSSKFYASGFEDGQEDYDATQEAWEWGGRTAGRHLGLNLTVIVGQL